MGLKICSWEWQRCKMLYFVKIALLTPLLIGCFWYFTQNQQNLEMQLKLQTAN